MLTALQKEESITKLLEFQSIFRDLAAEYEAGLIPFLLAGLEERPDLILPDGKHPNAQGQKIVAENVWNVLESYL